MGPQRAAKLFLERCGNASSYEVTLYGALAATGKGHMTDVAIEEVLKMSTTFIPWLISRNGATRTVVPSGNT